MANKTSRREKNYLKYLLAWYFSTVLCSANAIQQASVDNLFEMSFEQLLEVKVVSAAKQVQKVGDVASSIAVITSNQIKRRGYQFLADALRDLPGIDFIHLQGAYPNIMTFRGSYGDENKRLLLLVDGYDENSLNGSFEMGGKAYSLHNVERIEVIWGPGSALYGANALSGIINIITKHGDLTDNGFYLTKGIASFGTQIEKLTYHKSVEQHAVSFAGSWYSSNGPQFSNRHPDFSDAYADKVKSLTLRYSYKTADSALKVGGHLFDSPMGDGTFSMSPTSAFGLPDAGYQNTGNGGFLNYDINGQAPSRWHPFTQTLFIEHEKQVDKNWSWAAKMYQRKTGVDKDSYSYFYLGDNQFELGRWAHESKRLGLDLQLNYKTSDKQSWIIGVQYVDDDLEKGYRAIEDGSESLFFDGNEYLNLGAEFMAADKLKQNNLGIFSQVITQTDFNGKTDVTLGVRFDDNESYGSSVSPRLGLVNQVSPESNWIFKANYGEAFRAPAVFERFSASTVRVANPDLRPEEVKTFELAMSYQFERSIIQATWFSNHLSDVITAVLLPDGKNQNQNVGSIDVNGLELSFNHEFSKSAKLMFNYTYQTGEQKSASAIFDIPNIANHKFNIGLDYIINENTNLYINGNWVGKRSVAVSNPLTEVDGYFVSNLSLSKKNIFNSPLEFNWRVNNLFDVTYLDPGIRSADGQGIFATVHEQIGRNYSFELSYWF